MSLRHWNLFPLLPTAALWIDDDDRPSLEQQIEAFVDGTDATSTSASKVEGKRLSGMASKLINCWEQMMESLRRRQVRRALLST